MKNSIIHCWWKYDHIGNVWSFLISIHVYYGLQVPFLGIYSKEKKICNHTKKQQKNCTWMFLGALFTNAKNWKESTCLNGEWINKLWYNGILIYATTWMNHKWIMLKLHVVWFQLFDILEKASLYQKKTDQWMTDRDWREGRIGYWLQRGMRNIFGVIEMFCISVWYWLYNCKCLSKFILYTYKLYLKKHELYLCKFHLNKSDVSKLWSG